MEKKNYLSKNYQKNGRSRSSVDKCHSDSDIIGIRRSTVIENDLDSLDIKKYINDLIITTSLKKISNF